jgi:uncharacterized protein YihD (DUF1040 family)
MEKIYKELKSLENKVQVLELLEQAWLNYPELRFVQFMHYVMSKIPNHGISNDCFYTTDGELIKILKEINE